MIETANNDSKTIDIVRILQIVIASLGTTTNLIVVVVFLNHKKLRRKTPNICIIHQVSVIKSILCFYYQNLQYHDNMMILHLKS